MRSMARIPETEKNIRMTTAFGGYNHREIIQDGECFDMQNMSADLYPAMGTRRKRGITESEETLNGIAGRSELVLIRGEKVYYGREDTGLEVSTDEAMLPKKIMSLGAYVCIWPDKVYFNTHDFTDQGSMERRWSAIDHVEFDDSGHHPMDPYENAPVIQLCRGDGTNYDMTTITTASTAPKNPADGKLWIDTSGEADVLRQWSSDRKEWTEVPTVYLKISAPDIGKGLQQYDAVNIRDLKYEVYWTRTTPTLPDRVIQQLKDLNGSTIIYFCGDDYIVIAGMLRQTVNLYWTLEVDREVPDLDYMCESNNRIWGCKYGTELKPRTVYKSNNDNNRFVACDLEGRLYSQLAGTLTVSDTQPPEPEDDGHRWIDTSGEEDKLYRWDAEEEEWKETEPYVALMAWQDKKFGDNFKIGDYADIEGIVGYNNDGTQPTTDHMRAQAQALNGRHKVVGKITIRSMSNNYKCIVVNGFADTITNWTDDYTNQFVTIKNDRWDEGIFYNEIRACALGDFKNWNKYMGLSTDSYAASVGTDGPFTGAAAQAGYPVFFKENCIHKLYGAAPNSFQITTIMCRGVQQGSGRSVAVVNETILYKGLSDVMYFDGNMPQSIGENLGDVYYEDARAGAVNGKYYISMRHGDAWSLFVYDTKKGIWTREDDIRAMGFGTVGDELYLIDEENNTLVTVNGTAGTQESGPIEWTAVFGISGIEYIQGGRADMHKYLYMSRFDMRLAMDEDAEAELWIEYDSDGIWIPKGRIKRNRMGMIVLPVVPRRCDHLRAKITGRGGFRILSLSKVLEVGSDG